VESNEQVQQPVGSESASVRARDLLAEILERMGIAAQVEANEEPDQLRLDIACEEVERVVGRRGQVLDALQHLVGKMLFKGRQLGDPGVPDKPVVVDAAGYRERYAERLRGVAGKLAQRAIETGRVVALDPMPAHDRRIMHMALADLPGVTTRSEGEGEDRHMLIVPVAPAAPAVGGES
jgi:spoIIIJ-associated protein